MKTNGKLFYLCLGDDVIAEITPYEGQDRWNQWLEEHGEPWSMEIDFTVDIITFDETWMCAYMGRMYAEMFDS